MALACLGIVAGPACGEITKEVVDRAWSRIATADNFKVVPINYEKDDAPNAWVKFQSSENFSVHVTQGLMKILNKEEEVAGVLGHEIGHVRCGHYGESVNRNVGWGLIGLALGKAGGIAQAAGSLVANLAESGFSRGQEVEADDYGTDLLVKAGYSPWGLYNAMKSFKDNNLVTQPSGFNSHPPTDRRLQHLADRAGKLERGEKVEPVKTARTSNAGSKDSKDSKNSKNSRNSRRKTQRTRDGNER